MKIKCHNQTCQHIWEYSGKLPYTDCPICMSTVPISKQLIGEYAENNSIEDCVKEILNYLKSNNLLSPTI